MKQLMQKLKHFFLWLLGRTPNDPGEMTINHHVIAKQLKVEQSAIQAGKRNHPRSDATQPDANEVNILRYHQAQLQRLNQGTSALLQRLHTQRLTLREYLDPTRFNALVAEACHALDRLKNRWKYPLVEGARRERQADRDLKAFKRQNRLDEREAHSPISPLLLGLGFGVAIVVEGVVNAWAFANVTFGGWVAGLQQALILAAINVLIASVAGATARNLCHVVWYRKLFGLFTTGSYIVFLTWYTLSVGHLRMALLENPETAFSEAIRRMGHEPLAITDFNSVLLMLASFGFALAAFVAGFKAQDPYPGYTEMTRRYQERRGQLYAYRQQYLGAIDTETDPYYRAAIDACLATARRARDQFRDNIFETKCVIHAYRRCRADLEASAMYCVQLYRQTNEEVSNIARPAYFKTVPHPFSPADFLDLGEQALAYDEQFAKDFLPLASRLTDAAEEARSRIRDLRATSRQEADAFFAETEAMAEGRASMDVPKDHVLDQDEQEPQGWPKNGRPALACPPVGSDSTDGMAFFLQTAS